MNKINIHEILKAWGKSSEILPLNNSTLKNEILSKVSFTMLPVSKSIPTPYPYLSISFATLAIIVFVGSSVNIQKAYPTMDGVTTTMTYPMAPSAPQEVTSSRSYDVSMSPPSMEYYYPQDGVSAKDTREFLKTYYNATLKTRDVKETASKVEIAVRGFQGRVDSSNSSEDSGYVSFVIPATRYESFRDDIQSLVGKKLIVEQVSKENFLPQKQSLEEQKAQTTQNLTTLKSNRAELVKKHSTTVSAYNASIRTLDQAIASLQAEWPNATEERRAQISARLSELQADKSSLQKQLANVNATHQNLLRDADEQIKYAEAGLAYVVKADTNLMDNVATVNGTISLEKTNIWEISDIYTPGPLLAWLLTLAALLSYLRHKKSLQTYYN